MMKRISTFSLAAICLFFSLLVPAIADPDSKGTEFIFSFQNNYRETPALNLYITSDVDTTGLVEISGLAFSEPFSVQAGEITSVSLPVEAQELPELGSADLGILVTALSEVSVYGANLYQYTSDAFTAIPTDVLSNEYLVMSYFGTRNWYLPSEVAIVGTEDGTTVDIVPSQDVDTDKPANSIFSITLNHNEVYQFSTQYDFTGTYVRSSAPVAVMSGVVCADVPDADVRVGWCDHLSEMMLPLRSWGKSYLTIPLASRLNGDVVRVLASENDTEVRINGVVVDTLNRGEYYEGIIENRAHILASEPVMVTQYATGQGFDSVGADPFMAVIPANEQFLSSYTFSTPASGFARNYINVAIPGGAAIDTLYLDGELVDPTLFSDIGFSGYVGAQIPVTVGSHTIEAASPFGLLVYGFNSFDSYGYPGGMAIANINTVTDPFAPNISEFKHIGYTFRGMVTDSEDVNANDILDVGEDLNGNGILDGRSEDVNGNGVLDAGEDLNANGQIDRDRNLWKIELLPGSVNLALEVVEFLPGGSAKTSFTISLVDNNLPGTGVLRVTDIDGNLTDKAVDIPASAALTDLHVISTVSGDRIDVDASSFTVQPLSITNTAGNTVIEWQFDTFLANRIQDLSYEVMLREPTPGETRLVTQKTELNFLDINEERIYSELGPQYIQVTNSAFSLAVDTDQQNYGPDSPVNLSATVTNLGTADGDVSLEVLVEDSSGVYIAGFGPDALATIAPSASVTNSSLWNTGKLISGHYQLRAILRNLQPGHEGEIVGEMVKTFAIVTDVNGVPQTQVNATIGYDAGGGIFVQKLTYNTDDVVQMHQRVKNLAVNAYINGAMVQTKVTNPSGQSIYSSDDNLNSIAPGASADNYASFPLSSAVTGAYTVETLVIDSDSSTIMASHSAQFTVEQNIGRSVQGSVSAQFEELLLGDDQTCVDTVSNMTAFGLSSTNLQQSLIRLDTQEEIRSVDTSTAISANETLNFTRTEPTSSLVAGEYTCVLRVDVDGEYQTLGLDVFNVYNLIANPGSDQYALVGDIVTLSGANSREATNQPLSYLWTVASKPQDSMVVLSDPVSVQPSFIVDQQGTYVFQLIVNNGTEDSLPKTVSVFVPNRIATADAGLDRSVQVGETVTLDGSGSSDADGDILSFTWTLVQKPSGSAAELSATNIVNPTLEIDVEGIYLAELVVNDGFEDSAPDRVMLNVGNVPPVADAGADLSAQLGDTITLDGSASTDDNGDLLSYRWQFVTRPTSSTAQLEVQFGVKPNFVVDAAGEYVIQLIVNDGLSDSTPDTVSVFVGNSVPVANAGPDIPTNVGETVILDSSASYDLDGDSLRYRWSLLGRPEGSTTQLVNPFTASPQLNIDQQGDYIVQLIVNDGNIDSEADIVIVRVGNVRPVAIAWLDVYGELFTGEKVFFAGYPSYDPDGDPITYSWTLINAPTDSNAYVQDADTEYSFITLDQPGTYVVQLVVNDGELDSEPVSIFVQGVQPCVENFAVRPKSQKVQLTWTPDWNTNFYEILRSTEIDGYYAPIGTATPDVPTFLDVGLTDGVTYYYRVERTLSYFDEWGGEYCGYGEGYGDYYGDYFGDEYSDFPSENYYGEYDGEWGGCMEVCQSQILGAMPNYRVRMAYVPDLHGMSQVQAENALTQVGLTLGEITTERTTAVPAGQVVRQDAPQRSVLPRGTAVDIVLSIR